ncbi:hypothetical protein RJ640_009738 [Escallonia rubra]|uniref:Integrase catalytic domain-containing protein n=1 Tax=Escallonia rubra TaxID=112253 RepID=A0AA88ULT2_9ASTE|nr:hypothetical protein RJ640_009738 [Escallonia rubra]
MKQEPGQSINSFLSQMQGIWDQLELSEPSWTCSEDSAHFIVYRDHLRLIQFLISRSDAYESVQSSLLHRSPLPTLDNAVAELLYEETRRGLLQTRCPDTVLAAPSQPSHISSPSSTSRHSLCRKIGAGHFPQDCPRNPEKWSKNPSSTSAPPKPGNQSRFKPSSHSAAVADDVLNDSPSSTLSVNDVAEIVKQIMSNSGTPSSSALSVTSGNPTWYFDSGCCNHMTSDPFSFISKQHLSHYPLIHTADGSHMPVDHVGHVSTSTLSLPDTYFIPSLKLNLISVGQLCDLGFDLHFSRTGCRVQDPETGQTIGIGSKVGRLFELINLSIPHRPTIPPQSAASVTSQNSLELWHSRLGHVSFSCLHPLVSSGLLGVVSSKKFDCLPCQLAKQTALSFHLSTSVSSAPFDLVHSDIWGLSPSTIMGGFKYFVIFIDDYSRFTWLYLMRNRAELSQIYHTFVTMVKTQFSCHIKLFRTDNAMEYKSEEFLRLLKKNGTITHRSCPITSQQNGRAERKHRHILDTVRALLISASCPETFWGKAALTAIYTINRVPSPTIGNQTPYDRLYESSLDYSMLKFFTNSSVPLFYDSDETHIPPSDDFTAPPEMSLS